MKEQIVTTQAQLDAIPVDFGGRIIIKFGTPFNRAVVNRKFLLSVVARENSSVEAWGNSSVVARENSSVVARGNSSVVAWGNSQITDRQRGGKIELHANARSVKDPSTIREFIDSIGDLEESETTVRLFKAVHKRDGIYFSDNDNSFRYSIGGIAEADGLSKDPEEDCGRGIHIADKSWCVAYGREWKDLAIIEVEAEKDGIVVPLYGVGKVRARSVKVIREVPLEECGLLGKQIARQRGMDTREES